MNRRTVARVLAVILLSYGFAFLVGSSYKSDMVRYRSLSHKALLADLAKSHDGDFNSSLGESLLVIGLVVALTEVITATLVFVIDRIAPPQPSGTSDSIADATSSRFR